MTYWILDSDIWWYPYNKAALDDSIKTIRAKVIENLIADIEKDASSIADDKYIVVLTASQDFKFLATAEDFIVQVKKSGSTFSSI